MVIPAFNEAQRLPATLQKIVAYLSQSPIDYEIVVVDDGSQDDTVEVATEQTDNGVRVLRLERNRGKGAALRRGVLATTGRTVLLCDADLSTPIEELERLREQLDEAELVMASRGLSTSRVETHQPFYREWMGKTFNALIRLLGVRGFRDTQCGFKLLDGDVARQLFQHLSIERFAYDVELVWLALRFGYRVKEVGVEWHHVEESRVRLIRDSLLMIRDVSLFRWRHRRLVTARPKVAS